MSSEREIREALEEVLNLYNVKLDEPTQAPSKEASAEEDFSEIISKTQERLDDLNEKAEEIFQKTGMSREEMEVYAANPNNFSREQWEALQKVKEACEKYKREARSKIPDEKFEEKAQTLKRKKQPARFAKKKQWIPL